MLCFCLLSDGESVPFTVGPYPLGYWVERASGGQGSALHLPKDLLKKVLWNPQNFLTELHNTFLLAV